MQQVSAKCGSKRIVLISLVVCVLLLAHFRDALFQDSQPIEVAASNYAQGQVRFTEIAEGSELSDALNGKSMAILYQAIGEASMREALHSATTLRTVEGDAYPRIVMTDEDTLATTQATIDTDAWPFTRTVSVSQILKQSQEKRQKLAADEHTEYVSDEEDDALKLLEDMARTRDEATYGCKHTQCETAVVRAIRISKMRLILAMLEEFDMVMFLDSDTHICRSLQSLFAELQYKEADMLLRQVPVVKKLDSDWTAERGVPSDFPEAWGGLVVFRSTPKTKETVEQWLEFYKGYHGEAHPTSGQAHLREALWHKQPKFWEFGPEYGCPLFVQKAAECMGDMKISDTMEVNKLRGNHADEWKQYVREIDGGPSPCVFIHAHMVLD